MAGTKTSGNRTARRGRRPVQNLHISRGAAQELRILMLNARGARGRDDISEEQIVEELIAQAWRAYDAEVSAEAEAEAWSGEPL